MARAPEPVTAEVVAVGTGADDRRNDAGEPRRTLFSWAEFMAERPEQPKRRRRDEVLTVSLFEWALEREREGALGRRGALDRSTQEGASAMCAAFPRCRGISLGSHRPTHAL